MLEAVNRRPGAVVLAVAGYFLLCIILRVSVSSSLEIDEAEQAFLSQFLALGYGPQPPFYNWLQYGLAEVIGTSLATMTILKNGLLFLCCLFYGLAARLVLTDRRLPPIAMLGVLTLPPIFLLAQRDLSHTVAALFAVSLFLYSFLKTLKRPSLFSYILTGVAVGIGLMAKYNFVLVPVAAIVAVLPERELRARILDWRILPAIAVATLIVLPHAYWMLQNFGFASGGTLNEMREREAEGFLLQAFYGVYSLGSAVIGGSLVPLLVFGLVFRGKFRAIWQAESQWSRIIGRMLALCLIAVLLVVLGVAATHVREKWLVLFLVLIPLYLCLKIEAANIDLTDSLRRFFLLVLVIVLGALVLVSARAVVRPWFGDYSRLNIPYAALAEAVAQAEGQPALILVNDKQIAGNLRMQFSGAQVTMPSPSNALPVDMSKRPLLAVWHNDAQPEAPVPDLLRNALSALGIPDAAAAPRHLALPYLYGTGEDRYSFSYIWVAE
ncbi:ArnT family glycosyltransferase [Sinorhizobium prairiense]|uniref:ArnT family glycosyltransferase n=1 Tax=unclassified Sinorhizobium TaxID=2613772 RepID=UPI0023D7C1AE|nr:MULTISPECIES: glycosyltransferase family 39 protein [unclassified Sinorhizobium]WEJ10989.1 glycosyltransferase family 39 protein [Sinorhizobium sp. M103]WEJ14424.1 glycosyltransferase family 39 protein [Sinorhizobium sp. K101]WEJ37970.1 glycosyltransferase family 39 protein [Sinorhizobium sp. C101]